MKNQTLKKTFCIVLAVLGAALHVQAQYPWDTNLLANPSCDNGDYAGWTKTDGGSGWGIENNYWKSSHATCTMVQTVDLATAGFSATELDAAPYLLASGRFNCPWRGSSNGNATITVTLLDAADAVLQTLTVADITYKANDIPWLSYVQQVQLPAGTRKAKFYFAGKDSKGWGGQFGPCFDDMWLSLSTTENPLTYPVNTTTVTGGSIAGNKTTAHWGDTVKITSIPDATHALKVVNVVTKHGGVVDVVGDSTFLMPADTVIVLGEFWKA